MPNFRRHYEYRCGNNLCTQTQILIETTQQSSNSDHTCLCGNLVTHFLTLSILNVSWIAGATQLSVIFPRHILGMYMGVTSHADDKCYFELSIILDITRFTKERQRTGMECHGSSISALIASSWGQHGAQLGPTGPRWAPCGPHEPCSLGGP